MKRYLLYFSLIYFCSCSIIPSSKNLYKEVPIQLSNKKIKYSQSNYQMGWRDSVKYSHKTHTVNDIGGVSYLIAKNSKDGNLIGFNISTQQKILEISGDRLPSSEENRGINSIYLHNFDSIFISQTFMISLIDSSGKLIQQFPINQGDEKYALGNLHGGSPIFYDAKSNCIYLQSYWWKYKQNAPTYYKTKIETSVELETNEVKHLPAEYPEIYQENYYGYANHVYRETTDSLHIYSFPADPNFYLYNRYSREYKAIGGKSKYQKQPSSTLKRKQYKDDKAKIDHFSLTSFYHKVLHDTHRNCYYRFFSPELPLKNEAGLYNKNIDREYILMVFDESFKLIEEIKIGKHNPIFAFCTNEGLFAYRINKEKKKGIYSVFKVDIQ